MDSFCDQPAATQENICSNVQQPTFSQQYYTGLCQDECTQTTFEMDNRYDQPQQLIEDRQTGRPTRPTVPSQLQHSYLGPISGRRQPETTAAVAGYAMSNLQRGMFGGRQSTFPSQQQLQQQQQRDDDDVPLIGDSRRPQLPTDVDQPPEPSFEAHYIAAILTFFCCSVCSIVALSLAVAAQNEARTNRKTGRCIGFVSLSVSLVGVIIGVVVFVLIWTRGLA